MGTPKKVPLILGNYHVMDLLQALGALREDVKKLEEKAPLIEIRTQWVDVAMWYIPGPKVDILEPFWAPSILTLNPVYLHGPFAEVFGVEGHSVLILMASGGCGPSGLKGSGFGV